MENKINFNDLNNIKTVISDILDKEMALCDNEESLEMIFKSIDFIVKSSFKEILEINFNKNLTNKIKDTGIRYIESCAVNTIVLLNTIVDLNTIIDSVVKTTISYINVAYDDDNEIKKTLATIKQKPDDLDSLKIFSIIIKLYINEVKFVLSYADKNNKIKAKKENN